MKKVVIILLAMFAFLMSSCNPLSLFPLSKVVKKVRVEIVGAGIRDAYIISVSASEYETWKLWLQPYKQVEYYKDGTPHIFYRQYYYRLEVFNRMGGIKISAKGRGMDHKIQFKINEFYKCVYKVPTISYDWVVVNFADVED